MSPFRGWDHIDRLEKENAMLRAECETLKRERDNLKRTLDVTQACLGSAILTVGDLAIDAARKEGA